MSICVYRLVAVYSVLLLLLNAAQSHLKKCGAHSARGAGSQLRRQHICMRVMQSRTSCSR